MQDVINKLRSEVFAVLDGYFDLPDGTHITINPCKDPSWIGWNYVSVIRPGGKKEPTFYYNPKTGQTHYP